MCSVRKVSVHVYVCLLYRYSFFLWYFDCVWEMLRQCVWFFHCSFHLFCFSLCLLLSKFCAYTLRDHKFYFVWVDLCFVFPGTRYCCLFSHKTKSRQFMCGTWKVDTKLSCRKQQGQIIYDMHMSIKSIIPPPKKKYCTHNSYIIVVFLHPFVLSSLNFINFGNNGGLLVPICSSYCYLLDLVVVI